MAKRDRLLEIERERGDLHMVIPALLNECNGLQRVAAARLGVSPATISYWLKKHGYTAVVRWEKIA